MKWGSPASSVLFYFQSVKRIQGAGHASALRKETSQKQGSFLSLSIRSNPRGPLFDANSFIPSGSERIWRLPRAYPFSCSKQCLFIPFFVRLRETGAARLTRLLDVVLAGESRHRGFLHMNPVKQAKNADDFQWR